MSRITILLAAAVVHRCKATRHHWNSQKQGFSWTGFQLPVVQTHLALPEPLASRTTPCLASLLFLFTSSQPSYIFQKWLISKVPASA